LWIVKEEAPPVEWRGESFGVAVSKAIRGGDVDIAFSDGTRRNDFGDSFRISEGVGT